MNHQNYYSFSNIISKCNNFHPTTSILFLKIGEIGGVVRCKLQKLSKILQHIYTEIHTILQQKIVIQFKVFCK